MSKLWRSLEHINAAVPARWQAALGQDYDAVKLAFLRATGKKVGEYPCPHECGCWHEVIEHDENDIVGVCRCDPEESNCDNLCLTAEEIEQFDLKTAKLCRAVARAFGCEPNESSFDLEETWQIGAFGGAALPVILTMQSSAGQFRNVVANLVAKLQKPFILLAPTNRFLEINSQSLLSMARAGFFDLESNLTLTPSGSLVARRSGGELFSPLLPEKIQAVEQGEAAKVIAILSKLRSERVDRKAPLFEVFNLLVMDGCNQEMAAMKCGCTASTMSVRVKEMERKFGMSVESLRKFATAVNESAVVVKGDRWRKRSDGAAPDSYEFSEEETSEDDDD